MKYKILAIDIDGTLVSKNNKISKKNIEALKQYTQQGGIVVFVTGRSLKSSINIAQQLERKTNYQVPYICCLGSTIIYDYVNKKILHQEMIAQTFVEELFAFAKEHHLAFAAYTNQTMQKNMMPVYGYGYLPNFISLFKKGKATQIKKWKDEPVEPAYKINLILKRATPQNQELFEILKNKYFGDLEIIHTSKYLAEVTKKGINKEFGIRWLSKMLKIPLAEFAAIGDSANDIPMFRISGLRVAARKKHTEILNYVDHVVDSKQKHAVAYAINSYLLK